MSDLIHDTPPDFNSRRGAAARKTIMAIAMLAVAGATWSASAFAKDTLNVNVLSLPDDALELGVNYETIELRCITDSDEISCAKNAQPDDTAAKLVHTITLALVADPGHLCKAYVSIVDLQDFGAAVRKLLVLYATPESPGVSTLAFSRPILIEDQDSFRLIAENTDSQYGGCQGQGTLGVEIAN